MTAGIIINPNKKEVESSQSYKDLLLLNEARIKKVMGTDADWLIQTSEIKPVDPSQPDKLPDSEVYKSLQAENEWAWETIELLNKGWLQNKLWLDSIEDEAEADQAIIDLLKAIIIYWRTYLESKDPNISYKMPVLGSRFEKQENRDKAFDLITLMDRVLYKEITIEKLLTEWHGGKEWDNYHKKYDFDNSLWAFTQLLYLKKKYQAEKVKEQTAEKTLIEKMSEEIRGLELELKGEKQLAQAEITNLLKKVDNLKAIINKPMAEIEELTRKMPGAFPEEN